MSEYVLYSEIEYEVDLSIERRAQYLRSMPSILMSFGMQKMYEKCCNSYMYESKNIESLDEWLDNAMRVHVLTYRGLEYIITYIARKFAPKMTLLRAHLLPELCGAIAGHITRAHVYEHNIRCSLTHLPVSARQ